MSDFRTRLKLSLYGGGRKGLSSFVWICKIILPVSLLVAFLQWGGWLNQLDYLLNPVMNLINLPAEAALPIITGMLIGPPAVIAIITVVPFTIEQMTLIAIFTMIAHMLIMEGIIQFKAGIGVIKITLVRITAAIVTVLVVSQFFGDTSQSVAIPAELMMRIPFVEALWVWATEMVGLLIRILIIIIIVMIVLESSQCLGWIKYLHRVFKPFMRVLGLSDKAVMMWIAAVGFGVMYGSAVIIAEAKKGILTKEELEPLHISIGINHSMVEDPAIFVALGMSAFWLLVPRLIMAIVAVQAYHAVKRLKNRVLHK